MLISAFFLSALSLHAQFIWTGAGGDDNTTNSANWQGGVAPIGDGSEDFIFGDSVRSQPDLPTDFSVHNVTFTGSNTGYFWGDNQGTPTNLTVTGDIVSTGGSGPFFVFNQNFLTLAAGPHVIAAGDSETGGDLYVFGSLAGSGDILKTGAHAFVVSSPDATSTYTGNIDLQQGDLNVAGDGSLGTGTITMNGGRLNVAHYDQDHTVTLNNNLLFTGNTANFGTDFGLPVQLTITGTAKANSGVADAYIYVDPLLQLTFSGGLGELSGGTNFWFDGQGLITVKGAATYTGATDVADGTTVIFGSTAPSMVGGLATYGSGYIGSQVTSNLQLNFINRFNLGSMTGIIGFDSPSLAGTQTFSEAIDLTGFDSSVRLGTATSAILTGPITLAGSDYQFGGLGILRVTSNLTGAVNLTASDGLQLYLSGSNDYYGSTYADRGAAIVFDSNAAIPSGNLLGSNPGGYVGMTSNSSLLAWEFLGNFDLSTTYGVIGFDVIDPFTRPYTSVTVSDPIDLTNFDSGVFLGTSTAATLTGVITPQSDTYHFTGFRDGQLTVASTLSDVDLSTPRYVTIGLDIGNLYSPTLPGVVFHPSVTLTGDNTYTGGTSIQSGQLIVGQSNSGIGTNPTTALGTGEVYIQYFNTTPTGLSVTTDDIIIANPFDFSSNSGFTLGGAHNFTLAGNLKGCDPRGFIQKIDDNTVTLTGDNSNLDLGFQIAQGRIVFGYDTAAGTETLELLDNNSISGEAEFTSNAPSIGSLKGEGQYGTRVYLNNTGVLTINQTSDFSYDGIISGTGGINKAGPNSLTLSRDNAYTGGTTITNGLLVAGAANALGTGAVTINGGSLSLATGVTLPNPVSFGLAGGVLGGNGTFTGAVTIGTNAHLAPGNSPGTLNFNGGLTWGQGGTYDIQVQTAAGGPGTGFDTINVTGGLVFNATLGNPFTLNLVSLDSFGSGGNVTDFDNSQGYAWLIAHSDSLSGFDPNNVTILTTAFTNSLGSGGFNVSAVGNDIFLNFSPVPEPSTYALLGLGLGAVLFPALRRRRRV